MAFIIENGTAGPLEIEDLGITLAIGQISDISTRADPQDVALSMEPGNEMFDKITAGDLVVKDPLDGVTDLSVADAITCLQSINDPHFRVGAGALIGDISDVTLTSLVTDEVLQFNGTAWVNVTPSNGFSGLGIWRFRTAIAATPGAGHLQFNNVTINSATELYINVINDNAVDMSVFLAQINSGDLIYIQIQTDATEFGVVEVGTPTLLLGVYTFPIVNVESQGSPPTNNTPVAVVATGGGGGGGGGSTIVVQDEGVTVPNGPHGTLNFVGGGVVATDAGSGVTTVTIPGGAGVSNAITTVVGDSGSFTGVGEDTLNILGGSGISTAIAGDVLTITNDSPNVDQSIWLTMVSDAGSVAANTTTDQFSILGGAGISTSISGDVLTILNDSPNVDQNLWETILADAGSTVAGIITDTLTVAGGLGIDTSITGDTLDIILNAVIDNLQDVDTVTDPPVIGSRLVWKVATSKWEPQSPLLSTALGQMFEIVFSKGSAVSMAWIDSNGTPSNEAPPVCAWEARLAGLTFTNNRTTATTDIKIYRTAEGALASSRTLVETWSLLNARTARKTDYTPSGGGNFIPFFEGDKISVYFDGAGGPSAPRGVTLILHFIITDFSSGDVTDSWVGNITDP